MATLSAAELQFVKSKGVFIRHKCNHCHIALSQAHYYCLGTSDDRQWCSRECQDSDMGWYAKPKMRDGNHEMSMVRANGQKARHDEKRKVE